MHRDEPVPRKALQHPEQPRRVVVRVPGPHGASPSSTSPHDSPSARPRRCATTRPRKYLLDPSNRSVLGRYAARPSATAAGAASASKAPAARHAARTGHSRQVGRRDVQTVAPRSISAWFQAHALPAGRTRSAVSATSRSTGVDGQWKTRPSTRRTLVSTTATCRPCAKQASAFAVYSPTPRQRPQRLGVGGQRAAVPLDHRLRGPLQVQRPPVVAHARPRPDDLAGGRIGQALEGGEPVQEGVVPRG